MQEIELPAADRPLVERLTRSQGRLQAAELLALTLPDQARYMLALLIARGQLAAEVTTMQTVAKSIVRLFPQESLTAKQGADIIGEWVKQGLFAVLNDDSEEGLEKITVQVTLNDGWRKLLQAVHLSVNNRAKIVYAKEIAPSADVLTLHPKK
ncbi:MAG TPA: hypothetical protein VLG40_01950 [Candidatus Saccharimonas sp.]|nr:hypothetical protein [Candidatus Saccharimonas sp.]